MSFFYNFIFLLLITPSICTQLCYIVCTQFVPIGAIFKRPNCETFTNDSSMHCAVTVTFKSMNSERLHLFYVTPVIEQVRSQFIRTEIRDISSNEGVLMRYVYHDCRDCDIYLDRSANTIEDMQSLPRQTTDVIKSTRQLLFDDNDNENNKTIQCYGTTKKCLACRIEITDRYEIIQSCHTESKWVSIGVTLKEKTVEREPNINENRTFEMIDLQCTRPKCNTVKMVNSVLAILSRYNLAQHLYDIPSSAGVSLSLQWICVWMTVWIYLEYKYK